MFAVLICLCYGDVCGVGWSSSWLVAWDGVVWIDVEGGVWGAFWFVCC